MSNILHCPNCGHELGNVTLHTSPIPAVAELIPGTHAFDLHTLLTRVGRPMLVTELSQQLGFKEQTVRTVLARHPHQFVRVRRQMTNGGPANLWNITQQAPDAPF